MWTTIGDFANDMRMRVGINGFGRMGRLSLRAAWEWPEFDIVHINEIKGGPQAAAHLLEFDTVHGRWRRDIRAEAEAIRLLKEAAEGELRGILGFEERPLVSADYVNDPRSSIVDGPSTMVLDDTQVKILAWYDNEWGYVHRLMELTRKLATAEQ